MIDEKRDSKVMILEFRTISGALISRISNIVLPASELIESTVDNFAFAITSP